MRWLRQIGRWTLGTRRSIAGTVYGTILVMSVITAGGSDPGTLAIVVISTSIVFWISDAYSQGLQQSVDSGRRLHRRQIREVARRQSAIALAAVAPASALVLGASGLVRERTAIWLALGIGTAALAVQGVRYARLERLGPAGTVLAIGANLILGLAIVVLKAAVSH